MELRELILNGVSDIKESGFIAMFPEGVMEIGGKGMAWFI